MRKLFSLAFILTLLIAACQPAATANPAPATQPAATPVAAATKGATGLAPVPTTDNRSVALATAAISEIEGTAEQRNDEKTSWATAAVGQTLNVGNQVRTGPESLAAIQFAEGAITRLGPDTLFTVSELGGDSQNPLIKLRLAAGQLFVLITGSLGAGSVEVETPVGVASVRGSLMSVEVADDGRIVVTCLETTGNCHLESESGSVEIQSGQQAEIISAGEPPTPAEQIDDSQLNEWFQSNPEAQAIVLEDADADGYTILQGDCDDNSADIHPGLEDTPNDGVDQNCDGDDGVQLDEDGDGYTFFDGDCDDADPEVNPGAADAARDGLDANCDGFDGVDEGLYDGDFDDDEAPDAGDNCPGVYNPDQFDSDDDGVGDLCDHGDGLDSVDADGDGLADSFDQCPNTFGSADHGGCPPDSGGSFDTDGDGVADNVDQCPDQFGKPELGGCPDATGGSGDRDGDGVPDDIDQCPDQFGKPELGGCPDVAGGNGDRDGDSVPDEVDQCPDQAGKPELGGCPDATGGSGDRDGDGVPDDVDQCPDQSGRPELGGCPDATGGSGDRDGDGLPDEVDFCPDQFGDAAHGGCPPPDSDGDGATDDVDCDPFDPGIYPGANDPIGDGIDQNCNGFDGSVRNPNIIAALFKRQTPIVS